MDANENNVENVNNDVDPNVDPSARPARDGVAGVVLRDGKFRCGEALPNGNVCGSKVSNTKPAIARHLNNLHNPNSSYLRRQNNSEQQRCVPCETEFKNENSLRSHKRDYHGEGGTQRYGLGAEANREAIEPSPVNDGNAGVNAGGNAGVNAGVNAGANDEDSDDADNAYPGANITIGSGAKIEISAGFNVFIKPGSKVYVHPGAVVNFNAGAVINVEEF